MISRKSMPLHLRFRFSIFLRLYLAQLLENLDFLNKRAIYVYIREISGLNSKQLSVAMSRIRKHYKAIVHDEKIIDLL